MTNTFLTLCTGFHKRRQHLSLLCYNKQKLDYFSYFKTGIIFHLVNFLPIFIKFQCKINLSLFKKYAQVHSWLIEYQVKSYSDFAGLVFFAYWWSCIRKGLRSMGLSRPVSITNTPLPFGYCTKRGIFSSLATFTTTVQSAVGCS